MRVALFIPCYVDQLRPQAGMASLALLRSVGIEPVCPPDPICCGQPFLTAGEVERARALAAQSVHAFADFDFVVTPSGSCTATLRGHLDRLVPGAKSTRVAARVLELCEFLTTHNLLPPVARAYPHRVGVHASCHALRELGLGSPTETRDPARPDPVSTLLRRLPEIQLIDLTRRDECCGFGGVFSVEEEAVSVRMGLDRLRDHDRGRAEVLTSSDVSCLLHLDGLARKQGSALEVLHVAEILAAALPAPGNEFEGSSDGPR